MKYLLLHYMVSIYCNVFSIESLAVFYSHQLGDEINFINRQFYFGLGFFRFITVFNRVAHITIEFDFTLFYNDLTFFLSLRLLDSWNKTFFYFPSASKVSLVIGSIGRLPTFMFSRRFCLSAVCRLSAFVSIFVIQITSETTGWIVVKFCIVTYRKTHLKYLHTSLPVY